MGRSGGSTRTAAARAAGGVAAAGALAATLLAPARTGGIEAGARAAVAATWAVGRAVPVAVARGRAEFDVPTPGPGSRTLVVVSSLATVPGPYTITLTARAVATPVTPPAVATDGPLPLRGPAPGPSAEPPPGPPGAKMPPASRTFHVLACEGDPADARSYAAVDARLRAVGHRVQVYVDSRDADSVSPGSLRDLVATFDDRIYPAAAGATGVARDVDGDGRFTVLMTGWLSRLGGGRNAADGFFRAADLDADLASPFGNRCDMMYLSTTLVDGPHLRTVVAHEYAHAVTFSQKALARPVRGRPGPEEEGWLDEAIAHLAEDGLGLSRSNLDYRVSAFLSNPERYRLVVPDYYAADLFRSHGNRGATYMFLRWCVDRSGPGLLARLVRSGRRGVDNVEAATGRSFAALYREWSTWLFLDGLEGGPGVSGTSTGRGAFDDWVLAGPRSARVEPGGAAESWSAGGTTSHYAVVDGSAAGGVRVTVTGPAEAEVQVTAVRLPDDLPRVDLTIRADRSADGSLAIRAALAERRGAAVRLQALAWEPLVPAVDPRSATFRRAGLDALGIASAFGSSRLPGLGRLDSRPIRLAGVAPGHAAMIFKAVGTDALGRRVVGWAQLDPGRPRSDELRAVR